MNLAKPGHIADEEWGDLLDAAPQRRRDLATILSEARLFEGLNRRELRTVANILHHRDYMPRELIVRQGAPGVGMYIIQTGAAEVYLEEGQGDSVHLADLGPGRFFGEMSLLDGSPRAASVRATEPSHVLGFFLADLMDLIAHSPALGYRIVFRLSQLMAERLRETLTEYRDLERRVRRATTAETDALTIAQSLALVLVLYAFLVSIGLMGEAFKMFGKGFAQGLFDLTSHPIEASW